MLLSDGSDFSCAIVYGTILWQKIVHTRRGRARFSPKRIPGRWSGMLARARLTKPQRRTGTSWAKQIVIAVPTDQVRYLIDVLAMSASDIAGAMAGDKTVFV
jgi:hypothetical protein